MNRAQSILKYIDHIDEEGAKLIVRIRDKKVQRKLVCPKFFKRNGMACLKLTASDAKKLSKLRKKQFKKKIRRKLAMILKKRARSMGIHNVVLGTRDIKVDDQGGDYDKSK